jgi:hypothetical protein
MTKQNKQQASGKGFGKKAEAKHIQRFFDKSWAIAAIGKENGFMTLTSSSTSLVPMGFNLFDTYLEVA